MKTRKPLKITSRSSSITNAFVQAIIPFSEPHEAEIDEVLEFFGQVRGKTKCVYCGAHSTDWDHLRPLVRKKRPTGYLSDSKNLVPACGPCNQSKGGADWRAWISGPARGSPAFRKVPDLDVRIEKLHQFEQWGGVTELNFEQLIGAQKLEKYWNKLQEINQLMKEAQLLADCINAEIRAVVMSKKESCTEQIPY